MFPITFNLPFSFIYHFDSRLNIPEAVQYVKYVKILNYFLVASLTF